MTSLYNDLHAVESPILFRAAEAMAIIRVRIDFAMKNLASYTDTSDPADLVAAERLLEEIKTEIAHAQKSIATEINREEAEKVSKSMAMDGPFDQENPA